MSEDGPLVQRINLTTGMPHHALQKVLDGGGPQAPVQLRAQEQFCPAKLITIIISTLSSAMRKIEAQKWL
jgi:hypothetical protein